MSGVSARPARTGFALRQFETFSDMPAEWVDGLAQRCAWSSLDAGAVLMSSVVSRNDVIFLVSGVARMRCLAGEGKEVAIWSMGPGDLFSYPSADSTSTSYLEAVATESSVVAKLPRDAFLRVIRQEPAVAERVVLRLMSRMFVLVERVVDLSTLAVGQRLEAELLRLAHATGVAGSGQSIRLSPAPRHADLASRIGTNREQVTRELGRMVREELLAKDGTALTIADIAQLERRVSANRGQRSPAAEDTGS